MELLKKQAEVLNYETICFGNIVEIKSYHKNFQIQCYKNEYVFMNRVYEIKQLLREIENMMNITQSMFKSDLYHALRYDVKYNHYDNIITWNNKSYSVEYYNNRYNLWNEHGVEIMADVELNKVLEHLYSLSA